MQAILFVTLIAAAFCALPINLGPTPPLPAAATPIEVVKTYPLPMPEEVCVDPTETFFVTGGRDGYVYKVDIATGEVITLISPLQFAPQAFVEWDEVDVRAYCNGDVVTKETQCGRVLGVKFDSKKKNKVYIVNSYYGLYEYDLKHNDLTLLYARTGAMLNDLYVTKREIFFTVTHDTKQRYQLPYVVMDSVAPRGSLWSYNRKTEVVEQLADGMFFANGLELSSDGRYLYISETTYARILRYDLWEREMATPLISDLPIYTDNIYLDEERYPCDIVEGTVGCHCRTEPKLIIPGYWRHPDLDVILRDPVALDAFLATPASYHLPLFSSWIRPLGTILVVDEETGVIEETIYDNTGKFLLPASAHRLAQKEYLVGSVFVPYAKWIKVL